MNPGDLIDKTDSGLQELRTRAAGLPPRLRSLLILVDGRRTLAQLQAAAGQIGAPADAVEQLLQRGLVALRPLGAALQPLATGSEHVDLPLDAPSAPSAAAPADAAERFRSAQKLMNDSVVDAVGMRAFFFTLKLERCFMLDDLRALLPEYRRLLAKAADPARARASEQRVEGLLS
ncbi:MAG: hypothetical protein QM750_22590 [Rubrivivax sp.]